MLYTNQGPHQPPKTLSLSRETLFGFIWGWSGRPWHTARIVSCMVGCSQKQNGADGGKSSTRKRKDMFDSIGYLKFLKFWEAFLDEHNKHTPRTLYFHRSACVRRPTSLAASFQPLLLRMHTHTHTGTQTHNSLWPEKSRARPDLFNSWCSFSPMDPQADPQAHSFARVPAATPGPDPRGKAQSLASTWDEPPIRTLCFRPQKSNDTFKD